MANFFCCHRAIGVYFFYRVCFCCALWCSLAVFLQRSEFPSPLAQQPPAHFFLEPDATLQPVLGPSRQRWANPKKRSSIPVSKKSTRCRKLLCPPWVFSGDGSGMNLLSAGAWGPLGAAATEVASIFLLSASSYTGQPVLDARCPSLQLTHLAGMFLC